MTSMSHFENCGVHHSVCLDPLKCINDSIDNKILHEAEELMTVDLEDGSWLSPTKETLASVLREIFVLGMERAAQITATYTPEDGMPYSDPYLESVINGTVDDIVHKIRADMARYKDIK